MNRRGSRKAGIARVPAVLGMLVLAVVLGSAVGAAAQPEDNVQRSAQSASDKVRELGSEITLHDVLAWAIIAALVGSVLAMLVTRRKSGYGAITNFVLGAAGALVGGLLLGLLDLDFGLGQLVIEYQDLVNSFIGAVLILILIYWVQHRGSRRPGAK